MREPSIHTSRQAIKKYLQKNNEINMDNLNDFMRFCRKYSLDHRSVYITTKRQEDKISKRVKGSIGDANLATEIIYSTRIKLKHIGVTKIKQTDPQWGQIKELTNTINDFCNQFELPKRKGYIEFISWGVKLFMTTKRPNFSFLIKWFNEKADWIVNEYESSIEIKKDPTPIDTTYIHDIYCNQVSSMTGINTFYKPDSPEYVHFVRAKEKAQQHDVDYEVYIDAQFEALAFCNGVPKPEDLYGSKARERLVRYLSKNNLIVKKKSSTNDEVDWSKFK